MSPFTSKESVALRAHYSALKDKTSYDAFLQHGHNLLQRIGADPYHVRMALTEGYNMMEFGNRAAYQHRELDGGIEIGLLIRANDQEQVSEALQGEVHRFQGKGDQVFIRAVIPDWAGLPKSVLDLNEQAMRAELERIRDTKLVEQRRGSGTDNEALLYAVVNGIAVDQLPQPMEATRTTTQETLPMSIPLNRIFYGPPGTGKTYHSVGAAVEVCDPTYYAANKGDAEALRKRFNELLIKDWQGAEGRIAFCTFHQSYSYEDFVEGIKPLKPDEADKFVKYDVRPGILKQMARRASYHASGEAAKVKTRLSFSPEQFDKAEFYKISLGDTQNPEDQLIYEYCIKNNMIAIGFMDQHDLTGKTEQEVKSTERRSDQSSYSHTAMNFFVHYLRKGDYVVITNGLYSVRAIGRITGEYTYVPDTPIGYPHFRTVEWLVVDEDIPYQEIYNKQFSQQTIYKLKKDDIKRDFFVQARASGGDASEIKRFALIIDEINRGNVAGIFGELITLIEENKRKGRPEALEVTLPYSQEPFSIPDNLYIIGTMNTADRSVEALDAALRRRFSFVPMMPETKDLKALRNSRIDLKALLNKLNARLVQLLDEDHQLGHSHFWELHKANDPLPALRQVFKDKIIPQLEEYFHRDRAKLQMVLGERFVAGEDPADDLFLVDDPNSAHTPRPVYALTAPDTWDESAFRSLYEKA